MSRKSLLSALLLLLLALPALAADNDNSPWRISVLASDLAGGNQPWESDTHGGAGVAVAYSFRPSWDIELAAAATSYREPYVRFFETTLPATGQPITLPATEFRQFTVRPLDLVATRRFEGKRLSPYVRAGVRYVAGPDNPNEPYPTAVPNGIYPLVRSGYGAGFGDRVSAQAGAGVLLHLTPRTSLRAEVNRLLRTEDSPFDPLTRGALGVSWQF
jgi:Outer membrane protein beta-barrel domain